MSFNIHEFRSNIDQYGYLRDNHFSLTITMNPALAGMNINTATGDKGGIGTTDLLSIQRDLIRTRCANATIPGMALKVADINRYGLGPFEKMPFGAMYTDVALTFIVDRAGILNKFWYAWLCSIYRIHGMETGAERNHFLGQHYYTGSFKDEYASVMTIEVYDPTAKSVLKYKLYKAFPITMNDTALSWDTQNALMKLQVGITFKEWALEGVGMGPKQIGLRESPQTFIPPLVYQPVKQSDNFNV